MNRLQRRYAGIAVFGISALFAASLMTTAAIGARRTAAPAPSVDVRAASVETPAHAPASHTAPGPSIAFVPAEDAAVAARAVAAAEPARTGVPPAARTDGPRSLSVTHGDATRRRVALSFDAGSDTGYTAEILDTLARERIIASFGLTGTWAEQNPALVRRMAADGHHLINHTWSHDSFTGLSTNRGPMTRAQRWSELDRTEAAVQRIAGVTTLPYFRPPYGDTDASVLADVGARGYSVTAMWAVDSLGWNGLPAARIVERTVRLTTPGAILIFHVGSQSQDAAALPAIIGGLREAGYEFVPVKTLVEQ